ncbi:uncharacterized protein FTOL_03714 [Fusarium torulosum]|uniref:CBM1 domain-containing protein n=1 Tax=Fusarium torulosum TaxID=33205 RepID=A0AAE8M4J1_9HYPO|nr:uncharacterized protein FTOL_03714 [Fusarium torulosum]
MKLATTLFAIMASIAATGASPARHNLGCKPGTYRCDGTTGWEVCDTRAVFVFAGSCPPDTVCKFFEGSKSPYCVPPDFEIH